MTVRCKLNIVFIIVLLSKATFGLVQEDGADHTDYGHIEIKEDKIFFDPKFEDHLGIVGYIWKKNRYITYIPKVGVFPVEQKEERASSHIYVDKNGEMYLVRLYRYRIKDQSLDVFLQDKSLQIIYPIILEKGIYEFLINKLICIDTAEQVPFVPQDAVLSINQNIDISCLGKTLSNAFRSLIPCQLTISSSLTGTCDYNLKIMMSTIVLENLEFNLDTALFITSFKNLRNLQITQCTTQSPEAFVAISYLIKKLESLDLSGSTDIPEIFLKTIVSILKNKKFEFIPHDESQFLQYVKDNYDFELFEKIAFQLDTESAREFIVDTMINESNINLDHLEQAIVMAKKTGYYSLINKAITSFFEVIWKRYYPTTFIIHRIFNLVKNYNYYFQNIDNIRYYLSYCCYEIPIKNPRLTRNIVEFMAISDWDIIGNASYLLYIIDHQDDNKESAMKNLMDACNKNNILALYTFAKMAKNNGLFEQPASEEKDLMCKKIKDTFCTESVLLTCFFHERIDIVEYIQEYSQLIDNYLLSRNLI